MTELFGQLSREALKTPLIGMSSVIGAEVLSEGPVHGWVPAQPPFFDTNLPFFNTPDSHGPCGHVSPFSRVTGALCAKFWALSDERSAEWIGEV
jgi:hypothetical protein